MGIKDQKLVFLWLFSIFCLGSFLAGGDECLAGEVNHVVISEIQISGTAAADEFIELYNPTNAAIDLSVYSIQYKGGTASTFKKKNFVDKNIIPSFGFFLIANSGGTYSESADLAHSTFSLSGTGGTVFLVNDQIFLTTGDEATIMDKVAYGAGTLYPESEAMTKPDSSSSIERIIDNIVQDTDNNKNDFEIQDNPNPQNSIIDETGDSDDTGEEEEESQGEENSGVQEGGVEDNSGVESESNSGSSSSSNNFDIIITELVLNPEDDDRENEFIEIYNQGTAMADIGGWMMEDKLGGRITQFTFPENTILSPKEYRVFYRPETKITLNNSGDGVILKNSDGKIIDETPASGAALEDWSWSRNRDSEWEWSLIPTAGEENIFKEGTGHPVSKDTGCLEDKDEKNRKEEILDYSDEIVISEIFPNPEGRDNQNGNYEWIELYNFSDQKINLRGWQVDDFIDGGSRAYFIEDDLEISPRSYLALDYSRTKIVLNNNGDEVNLLDPDGKVISKVVYQKGGKEGWSYARLEKELSSGYPELSSFSDSFMWSDSPTPGKENIFKEEPPLAPPSQGGEKEELSSQGGEEEIREDYSENNPQEISITEAKKLARYSWVKIRGTVSAPTGVFGEKTIYLSGSGIQIYSHQEDLPDLRAGDVIELTGRVSEIGGEKRILLSRADDLKIVGYQEEPEPMIILTGEAAEPIEGYLVTVEGKVTETSGNVFYLDDGSGEVKIYIKPSTGIKKPPTKKGDWMVITGQVSRTSAGYRILPRFQDDIRAGRVSGISASLTEAGNSLFLVILILVGVMVLGDWGRIKLNRITNHES